MDLAAFYAKISRNLKRGTAFDADIPGWAEMACSNMENNKDWSYMQKLRTVSYVGTSGDNFIAYPTDPGVGLPKRIDFVRFQLTAVQSTEYSYVQGVTARDVTSLDIGPYPQGFFYDGVGNILFDSIPNQNIVFEIGAWEYTPWPTDTGETPGILLRYPKLLEAETMLEAAPSIRDDRLAPIWKGVRDEALAAAIAADDTLLWSSQEGMSMSPDDGGIFRYRS